MAPLVDLNTADLATLLGAAVLDARKADLIMQARPFWDFAELKMLPGFGAKTLRQLREVAEVVPPARVNLNTCDQRTLQSVPHVGQRLAERLIAERPFEDFSEVSLVKGVNAAALIALQNRTLLSMAGLAPRVKPVPASVPPAAPQIVTPPNAAATSATQTAPEPNPAPKVQPAPETPGRVASPVFDALHAAQLRAQRMRPSKHQATKPPTPASTRAEVPTVDVLTEEEWVTMQEYPEVAVAAAPGALQVQEIQYSLAEHQIAVHQEIRRRLPVFFSGWAFASVLLAVLLGMYVAGWLQFGPEVPAVAVLEQPAATQTTAPAPAVVVKPAAAANEPATPVVVAPTSTAPVVVRAAGSTPLSQSDIGKLLFTEIFAPGDYWTQTGTNNDSAIEITQDRLQISLTQSPAISWSVNAFRSANFFYQGTVEPRNCNAGDYYGLVFRYQDDANLYLFGVSCNGEYRVLRRSNGAYTVLADFTANPAVATGNKQNLLGVHANGAELNFYVNDISVGGLNDGSVAEGFFGFFAKTEGNPGLQVYFDDAGAWGLKAS